MKLAQLYHHILNEVGEGTSQPFEYKKGWLPANPALKMGKPIKRGFGELLGYDIHAETSRGEKLDVKLGVYIEDLPFKYLDKDIREDEDIKSILEKKKYVRNCDLSFSINNRYPNVNDKIYMFRLMATIKQIMLEVISKYKPDTIAYSSMTRYKDTTPSQSGRHLLYKRFIEKSIPIKKILLADSDVFVYLLK